MIPDDDLFTRLGIRYLDHVAVTTPALETTLAHYLALPDSRLLRGPAENPAQRVRYAFVTVAGTTFELLSPLADSPIAHHLRRGGGAYHLCYAVDDLDGALNQALAGEARVIAAATPDPAFDGRRVAFLHHRAHGLFELVEAYPPGGARPTTAIAAEAHADSGEASPAADDTARRLIRILNRLFPTLAASEAEQAALDHTDGWDSASHLVLMMEIESEFDLDIPTERIAEATDYPKLIALIEKLVR
ncbi:VOC family protein [Endothiovibrio diazotrophicus]